MRRSTGFVAVLAATAGTMLTAVSAQAAGTPVTIVRDANVFNTLDSNGVPVGLNGLTFHNHVSASDPNPATGSVATIDGPATPPMGTGSLRISTGSNGDTGSALFDQSYLNYDLSPIIAFPIAYNVGALVLKGSYNLPDADTGAEISITLWQNGSPSVYDSPLATGTGWQTFDVQTAQFTKEGGDATQHPITGWFNPGDSLFAVYLGYPDNSTNANPNKTLNVDDLTYGFNIGFSNGVSSPHPVTEYDFETNSSAPSVVTAGKTIVARQSTVLSATVKQGATAVPAAHLDLMAKPFGASSFSKVTSVNTNSSGIASAPVAPVRNTSYKWIYKGTDSSPEIPGVASNTVSVNVRDLITKKLSATTIAHGKTLTVTGTTYPAKPGTTVTLFRAVTGPDKALASAKVASNGTYKITKTFASAGRYNLYVFIPAVSGNLSNATAATRLTVT